VSQEPAADRIECLIDSTGRTVIEKAFEFVYRDYEEISSKSGPRTYDNATEGLSWGWGTQERNEFMDIANVPDHL